MEVWAEATIERRPGGILYLSREGNKGTDATGAILLTLLEYLPDGAKRVRITVEALDG